MKIELRKGDITDQPDIDAIVNAANTDLLLGSGVAGAIRTRGGPDIQREAVAQGPVSLGDAVRTTAGNLPNRFVIHAAAMGYRKEDRLVPKRESSASSEDIIKRLKRFCYKHPRPAVTVDIALFHRSKSRIEVLLIKRAREPFKGLWAFPGGFVDDNEALERAAARELLEETGLSGIHLEQIGAFGDPGRDPRGHTISIVFAAVLDQAIQAHAADDAADAAWYSALRPPKLAFDHKRILSLALKRMLSSTS